MASPAMEASGTKGTPIGRRLRPGMKVRAWDAPMDVADSAEAATVVEVCEHGCFIRWDKPEGAGEIHACTWDMIDIDGDALEPAGAADHVTSCRRQVTPRDRLAMALSLIGQAAQELQTVGRENAEAREHVERKSAIDDLNSAAYKLGQVFTDLEYAARFTTTA